MSTPRFLDRVPSEVDDLEQLRNACLGRDEVLDECLSLWEDTYSGGCYFYESLPHPGVFTIDEILIHSKGWGTDENFAHEIGLGKHLTGQNSTETRGKGFKLNFLEKIQKLNEKKLETSEKLKTLKTLETLSLLRTLQILDPANRDAYFAMEAMTSTSISCLQVVVELACTRSSRQLLSWKQAYHAQYKKSPEEDIAHRTSGDFRELLVPLVSSYRYDGDEVNLTLAKEEAKILREKILDKAYGDDDLIRILATRSKAQVNATLNHYRNEFGNDINKDLKTDPKDQFLFILRATVKCLTRPEKYFEKVLRLAINRRGTDEAALIRVVVTRAEVDMKLINEEYQRRNNVPLHRAIVKDTHGEYEKMLLALVGHADP